MLLLVKMSLLLCVLALSRLRLKLSPLLLNAQAQATSIAWSDAQAAAQNDWAAQNAYGTSNEFAADASWQFNAAANARGAEYQNAWAANNDAWAGNYAAAAAATPQYFGAGYGMGGAPFMW